MRCTQREAERVKAWLALNARGFRRISRAVDKEHHRAFYRLPPNRAIHAHKCSTSVCFIVRKSGRFQHLVCLEEESSLMGGPPSFPPLPALLRPPSLSLSVSGAIE